MKVKVNWRKLCQQLWEAAKPVLLAAIGGGIVTIAAGCSSLSQTPRGQTTEIVAVGIPAIAWISHTAQDADHSGSDTNGANQANSPVVPVSVDLGK